MGKLRNLLGLLGSIQYKFRLLQILLIVLAISYFVFSLFFFERLGFDITTMMMISSRILIIAIIKLSSVVQYEYEQAVDMIEDGLEQGFIKQRLS